MNIQLAKLTATVAIVLCSCVAVHADDFSLDWWTVDGGGALTTSGGDFELSGTIGQPDAGDITGGDFDLSAGFWAGISTVCFGDLDGDGQIGLSDLAVLIAHYEEPGTWSYADGDLDGDGDVDLSDLAALLGVYGTDCS